MPPNVRLAICHRNRLFRESLSFALRSIDQYEVAEVDDQIRAELPSSSDGRPEVFLIDASLSDSGAFRLVRKLSQTNDRPRTILMVAGGTAKEIESCVNAGADGCVLDEDTFSDLCLAIETVRSGRSFCSPQLAHRLFTNDQRLLSSARDPVDRGDQRLTRRELEILRLIAHKDLSNKQIARALHLSVHTVKNYVHSIIEKLSAESRRSAVRHAVDLGLLTDRAC